MNFSDFKNRYQKQEVEEYSNQVTASPVVSIMVQTYQHKNYIRECIEGILNQKTDFDFEILLGEDGSTDGTREICIEYAEIYPEKIRLFLHHPDNKIEVLGIPTGNFNALYNFYSTRGEFVAFCEGDDLWTDPLKLQKQVEHLQGQSSLAITYHSYLEVNEKLESLPEEKCLEQPKQIICKEDLQRLNFHPLLSTICFKNSIKDNLPEEMVGVINVDSFLISLLGNFGEAGFLEGIKSSFYRRHEGGIWRRKRKKAQLDSKLLTYQKLKDFYLGLGKKDLGTFFHRRIISTHKMQVLYCLRSGDPIKAAEHLRKLL
ncbi:glycosyltransferase [Salinimicrobium xinjiangense]|uniref:glycosyltransferase n=1 Tax=Salinimicrobium xinjiangense TaxID=438596 RepID=UPI000415F49E|nr:glycosyltransferase [Salinimicrobium xinjiangense]